MFDLISIIVPVYNAEEYLVRCLDSLIEQSYHKLEIILIDDGSADKSENICMEYANKDNRIKYYRKENGGAASARNFGIGKATGKYIGFVDSDDIIHKDMFKTLYGNMFNNKADLSICEVVRFTDIPRYTNENKITIYDQVETLKILLEDKKICSYSVNKLCKRELIKDIKYPEEKLQEDVGTIYKFIIKSKRVVYSNSQLYGYYTRSDSITNSLTSKFIYDYFEMIEKRENDLQGYGIDSYLKLSKVNVILGIFINLSHNQEVLKDTRLKEFMDNKYLELKKENTREVRKINTKKHNILISLLIVNKQLFYTLMDFYLKVKK